MGKFESKCEGNAGLDGASFIYTEKDWKTAKKRLDRMKEYTPNGTWNHVFFDEYDGVEKLVIHKLRG